MRRRAAWAVLVLALVLTVESQAVVFHDSVSNVQRIGEFLWLQGQEMKKYVEMVETTRKMIEQVKGTYKMIEYAAQNVEQMAKEGKVLPLITSMSDQMSGILAQVQWIGFNLDRTTAQFATLYGHTAMLTTPAGRWERYRQMREARKEMTGIAMQTQSIRETFTNIYHRLATLLSVSSFASGQKALAQLQIEQQAMMQKQQQLGLSMQAVTARLIAMEQAEKLLKEEMLNMAAEQMAKEWYAKHTTALPAGFDGFRILPRGMP